MIWQLKNLAEVGVLSRNLTGRTPTQRPVKTVRRDRWIVRGVQPNPLGSRFAQRIDHLLNQSGADTATSIAWLHCQPNYLSGSPVSFAMADLI